jgi:hypothetical protein
MAQSFREPDHLPKRGGRPPAQLPRQRRGTTPQMHGRYPDYDVLENAEHWDPVTRELVLSRVYDVPQLKFFTPDEATALRPFLHVALGQDAEPRIPVLEMVDAKLHAGEGDGYRHADMPEDEETWRRVARHLHADGFPELVVMRHALSAFYSHPWAWNEIGFGGPAYPRGYIRMGVGDHRGREPHEGEEAFGPDPVRDT